MALIFGEISTSTLEVRGVPVSDLNASFTRTLSTSRGDERLAGECLAGEDLATEGGEHGERIGIF